MKINPINNIYYQKKLAHKGISTSKMSVISSKVSDKGEKDNSLDEAIINYLDKSNKREEQNKILFASLGVLYVASLGVYMAFLSKKLNNRNKLKDSISQFRSLANDNKIPTLDTCKSINDKLKDFLQNQITYHKATQEQLKEAGMPEPAKKLLLYGPPGTGKTYFAKIFAKTLNAEYLEVKYSDLNHRYVGHHLENIKNMFDDVIKTAQKNKDKKYVLTFNEIDAIIVPQHQLRGDGGHSNFKKEERNVFLNFLDEVGEKVPNVTIIGTTNGFASTNSLDGAAMSRFRNKIKVDFPDSKCLEEAIKNHFKDVNNGTFITEAQRSAN